eukprot:4335417-Pleurochrysis_carterae.AAC.5
MKPQFQSADSAIPSSRLALICRRVVFVCGGTARQDPTHKRSEAAMTVEQAAAEAKHEEEEDIEDVGEDGAMDGEAAAAKRKKKKKSKKKSTAENGAACTDENVALQGQIEIESPECNNAEQGDAAGEPGPESKSESQKKREKKKAAAARKKAAEADGSANGQQAAGDASAHLWSTQIRGIQNWGPFPKAEAGGIQQTWPPTVPVLAQFPSGQAPKGMEMEYGDSNRFAHVAHGTLAGILILHGKPNTDGRATSPRPLTPCGQVPNDFCRDARARAFAEHLVPGNPYCRGVPSAGPSVKRPTRLYLLVSA